MSTRTISVLSIALVLASTLLAFGGTGLSRLIEKQLGQLTEKESTVEPHLKYLEQKLGPKHPATIAANSVVNDIQRRSFQLKLDLLVEKDLEELDDAELRKAVLLFAQHIKVLQGRVQKLEDARRVRVIPVECQ
jgi:hypothetical protein